MEFVLMSYHLAVRADADKKASYPMTRGAVYSHVRRACDSMGCELQAVATCGTDVHLVITLRHDMSLAEFVADLKKSTSKWIMGDDGSYSRGESFWEPGYFSRPVSPEDKDAEAGMVREARAPGSACAETLAAGLRKYHDTPGGVALADNSCHIIFTTSRNRMLLSKKYRLQIYDMVKTVCEALGCRYINAASMRNHVHVLCDTPHGSSISKIVDGLRANLLEQMNANRHFRRFEGWSDVYWAYTVSAARLHLEEHEVCDQERAHFWHMNEMCYLSDKLGTPWHVSLV